MALLVHLTWTCPTCRLRMEHSDDLDELRRQITGHLADHAGADLLGFVARLRAAWKVDTSELPDQWTADNPSTGQCHVSAILIQRHFGGDIVHGYVYPPNGIKVQHFWNVIDGVTIDVTRDQFPAGSFVGAAFPVQAVGRHTLDKADVLAIRMATAASS